jgi:hypothetical protein
VELLKRMGAGLEAFILKDSLSRCEFPRLFSPLTAVLILVRVFVGRLARVTRDLEIDFPIEGERGSVKLRKAEEAYILSDADQELRRVGYLGEVAGLHYFLEGDKRHIKYAQILLLEYLVDLDEPRLVVLVLFNGESSQNRKDTFNLGQRYFRKTALGVQQNLPVERRRPE